MKSFLSILLVMVPCMAQDKFQQCCGEKRLYYEEDGECYLPLQQGPCQAGEWIIMERGGSGRENNIGQSYSIKFSLGVGVCKKTPCDSNIQFKSEKGACIFGVDLLRRGELCGGDKRPWYSVYGEWECKKTYLSLPFGSISDKTTQDDVWKDCKTF